RQRRRAPGRRRGPRVPRGDRRRRRDHRDPGHLPHQEDGRGEHGGDRLPRAAAVGRGARGRAREARDRRLPGRPASRAGVSQPPPGGPRLGPGERGYTSGDDMNWFKTFFWMAALGLVLVLGGGLLFGQTGVIIGLLLALVMNGVAYFYGDRMAL